MPSQRINYPYPVLGNGDDIDGFFDPRLECTPGASFYVLDITMGLSHSTIVELIQAGVAQYSVEIVCVNTFYREVKCTSNPALSIPIPAERLRDRVEVSFEVIALVSAGDYMPDGVHPDLAGEPFSIEPGGVLARGGQAVFIADPLFDPMRDSAASFVKVREVQTQKIPMSVDYENDDLVIQLSSSSYSEYIRAREYAPEVIHAALVLPVLVSALQHCEDDARQDFLGYGWYDRLVEMRSARGLVSQEPLIVAQTLLGEPVERCLSGLSSKQLSAESNEMMEEL